MPSSFIATGYSLLLLPSSSLSNSQPLICVPMSFPLYRTTWRFFITMPFPLEYSYLYTKRVQSWGHLFCCHFCMDATWNLPGNSMLSHESPPLLWLFDRKEWVGYVFGDTPMSNFTSRMHLWYHSQRVFQSGLFPAQETECEFWKGTHTSLAYTYIIICHPCSVTVDVLSIWSIAVFIFVWTSFSCLVFFFRGCMGSTWPQGVAFLFIGVYKSTLKVRD